MGGPERSHEVLSAYIGSDAIAKGTRSGRLVGHIAEKETGDNAMFNGNDHGTATDRNPSPAQPNTKPQGKPAKASKPNPAEGKDQDVRK